jgi:calcineurin-like phosphoesterase family protein
LIVIGDIHGKVDRYLKLLASHRGEPSVQLGDFGIGFPGDDPLPPLPGNAWFIRGNHDNPEAARYHANYLGDYGSKTIDGIRIFYLSGAWSCDQWHRTEGVNWWRDEELCAAELQAAFELYEKLKPEIVLTHDGPDEAVRSLLDGQAAHKELTRTSTGNALNAMLESHRPKKWIFGHWHTRFRRRIGGTEFHCLPELAWCRIQGDFEKLAVDRKTKSKRR